MNKLANERPNEFKLRAHTGMLESLGHNMYSSIAKSLVEFVANGYDADAAFVKLSIPFKEIEKARATAKPKSSSDNPIECLQNTILEDVSILIEDDGHGMDYEDIQNKFMPINRNRRKDLSSNKSVSGRRYVMGRKGLGKLAGFGIAELITITSKKAGDSYETTFVMDYNEIKKKESLSDVSIPATYNDNVVKEAHYTKIKLDNLRSDTLKSQEDQIVKELVKNFHIVESEFQVFLNNEELKEEDVKYDFTYPIDGISNDGYFHDSLDLGEIGKIAYKYIIRFRSFDKEIANKLLADYRGARIYCNGRLALGPSLLNLKPGAHTFHAQNNMECIVHADELDRNINVDFTNTNRTSLKADNEIVSLLIEQVSNTMQRAIDAYNEMRNNKIEKEIEVDEFSKGLLSIAEQLSDKSKQATKKVLKIVAVTHGIGSQLYREVAPLLVQSVNAGEVLTRLISLQENPLSISNVLHELNELKSIEDNDVLKLYRGRRNGIIALQNLINKGDDLWKKQQFEAELHNLLKDAPWLIRPEYSRFLSSNEAFNNIIHRINKEFKIDSEADIASSNYSADRPDLVFVLSGNENNSIVIVELKSPALPLNAKHLEQLKKYRLKIKNYVSTELMNDNIDVYCYLIGSMPEVTTKNEDELLLLEDIKSNRGRIEWDVLSLPFLLERAKKIHLESINLIEKKESED